MKNYKNILAYIFSKTGCIHPFRLSRILALAEVLSLKERGSRLTDLKYNYSIGVFYIEGLKEIIESDECFVKHEGDPATRRQGCIEYRCKSPIVIDEETRSILDKAIKEASKLDDFELNKLIVENPLFKKLIEEQ